ncbi:uncharacterized protein LOC130673222 isoform X2 [Microplitis mediator]|uniref:uncharacterized protein LOC130673222 isoform X2 n=1 Tax=Microplitis mediator TaxID=375433 RepID=UPI0025577666|nr:uncharacterized protein LOC130673222 isoform X2 [Microplitis mediator]
MKGLENIFFILILISHVKGILNNCNYEYKYSCNQDEKDKTTPGSHIAHQECSLNNILDNANYTLILSENGLLPTGIMKVNITLPSVNCIYKVALLVNDTIKNDSECRNHEFTNIFNSELHSIDQTICSYNSNIGVDHDSSLQSDKSTKQCQEDNISLYFEHVYSGCYALRYTIDDNNYAIHSNKYITTSYQRTEVMEPVSHCYYDDRALNNNDHNRNLVTFTFSISILSGSSSLILQLIPLSFEDENKEEACIKYGKKPLDPWEISLYGSSLSIKNCSSTMVHDSNGSYTEDIECIFVLPVLYNESYCFLITLNDDRCIRQTVWNPPPIKDESSPSCTWISHCTRVSKSRQAVEYSGELLANKTVTGNISLLLPIAAGIIILILIISGTVVCVCRLYVRKYQQNPYLNATLNGLKSKNNCEVDGVDTDDDNDNCKAIVIFYARGSKSFMKFIAVFREIVEYYGNCHVYDWYAPSEWDSVAKVGAHDWANNLFEKNYRVIWIDTPSARSLINIQNSSDNFSDNNGQLNVDSISDFRDLALAAVVNCVKRNIKLQYTKHFIVRIEGYNNGNSSQDPFADLSPHARYLIPYHLKQLLSHLTLKRSENSNDEIIREETRLREKLIEIKNDL